MAAPPRKKKSYPTYESQQFAGEIVADGKRKRLQFTSPAWYKTFIEKHCQIGDQVTVNVTNKRPKRSSAQNRYYHEYLSLIGLSSGHTLEELKAWVKNKYLTKGIKEVFGTKVRIVKSSADLKIPEFIELLERIYEDTTIPLPNADLFSQLLTHEEYARLKAIQKSEYLGYTAIIR